MILRRIVEHAQSVIAIAFAEQVKLSRPFILALAGDRASPVRGSSHQARKRAVVSLVKLTVNRCQAAD
jgi:hypothetical protein